MLVLRTSFKIYEIMKRLILFFLGLAVLSGCSMDDGEDIVSEYAKVTNVDFPPYFELGESYDLEVTYNLPSACHSAMGIDVFKVGSTGEANREIYIAGVVSYDRGAGECTRSNTDPERKEKFTIIIEEAEPYKFYLFQGLNSNNQAEYTTVTVRVGAPGEQDPD